MAYARTTWQDGITPVDGAHMNNMEDELVLLDGLPRIPTPIVNGQWLKGSGGAVVWSAIAAGDLPDISGTYQARSEKAAASGYASLDATGKVPSGQLPAIPPSLAYIPVELRNPPQSVAGVYPNIVALAVYERWYWEFSNADCKVWGQFAVPPNITPVPANQQIIFDLVCSLTTGLARFNVKTRMVADGESTNPGSFLAATSQDIAIPATAQLKKRCTFAISGENWRAGDTVIVEVMREGAHANDTLAGVCGLLGIYARIQ